MTPFTSSHKPLKLFLGLLVVTGTAIFAPSAHSYQSTSDDLLQCDKIKKPDDRLACFNTVVEKLKEDPEAFSPERKADKNRNDLTRNSKPRREKVEEFGKRKPNVKKINKLSTAIRRYWQDPYGRWVFYLENGQIWREQSNGSIIPPKNPQSVQIKRGLFGGYRLKVIGSSTKSRTGTVIRLD